MSRVLVLGAAGMLGHKMLQTLRSEDREVVGTVRGDVASLGLVGEFLTETASIVERVNVADLNTVQRALDEVDPDVVVNCVGVVKQRPTAKDSITSITVNALFPHQLASMCAQSDRRLIHFSTDCVFSGRRGSYTEEDESDALDLYGRTKYLGEIGGDALTLRTSIIGRELSTFQSLVEWFISQNGETVQGFERAMYSGVTTLQAARTVGKIIDEYPDLSGLYQMVGPVISKYDLLCEIRDAMELDISIVPNSEFVLDRTLEGDRFAAKTGIVPPSWTDMITEMANDPTPYEDLR